MIMKELFEYFSSKETIDGSEMYVLKSDRSYMIEVIRAEDILRYDVIKFRREYPTFKPVSTIIGICTDLEEAMNKVFDLRIAKELGVA